MSMSGSPHDRGRSEGCLAHCALSNHGALKFPHQEIAVSRATEEDRADWQPLFLDYRASQRLCYSTAGWRCAWYHCRGTAGEMIPARAKDTRRFSTLCPRQAGR